MKEETIQKIEAAFESLLRMTKINIWEVFTMMAKNKDAPPFKPPVVKKLFLKGTQIGFKEAMRRSPEPKPRDLQKILHYVQNGPETLHAMALELAKVTPRPKGGRPPTPPEQKAACIAKIRELLPQCENPTDAFLRAGAAMNPPLSIWTVRRIWREHLKLTQASTLKKRSPKTMHR